MESHFLRNPNHLTVIILKNCRLHNGFRHITPSTGKSGIVLVISVFGCQRLLLYEHRSHAQSSQYCLALAGRQRTKAILTARCIRQSNQYPLCVGRSQTCSGVALLETVGTVLVAGEYIEIQPTQFLWTAKTEFGLHIHAAGTDQRRVEPIRMVGCHE